MVTTESPPEQRMVLYHVSWDTYERLLHDYEQCSSPRFTYDRGILEIMSPFSQHEAYGRFLDCLMIAWADATDTLVRITGSTTYKREDLQRGFEPDSSYYIQHEPWVRGKERIDLHVDPPPDLLVEIDITHSSLDKLSIYAQVGVPEVWRYDGAQLHLLVLREGTYVAGTQSGVMPSMTADALLDLLRGAAEQDAATWLRRAQAWARSPGSPGAGRSHR
jgi:Uma2 family endonuclease